MIWNWQHPDWPNFSFDAGDFAQYERDFQYQAGVMAGSLKHIADNEQDLLRVVLFSDEAFKTSEIEGELLDRDSLKSSVRKQFGLQTDNRKVPAAEQGVSEMLVDVYQHYHTDLSHEQLFKWHTMLTSARRDLKCIGAYRSRAEPMQIVSGKLYEPTVHYEAPPSCDVPTQMDAFVEWFNKTAPSQQGLPPLLRAGIAHLYFESIHPFEDGNGRIGRAISEKALSQSLGRPTLIAIATSIEKNRKQYYSELHSASRCLENVTLDISQWLHFFCQLVLEAQDYSQQKIDFLVNKGLFYQRFGELLNERQSRAIARIFREGVEGFTGGLSAQNYIRITGASRATATRDLQSLVDMGALQKHGERKHTRYYLFND